MFPFQSIVDQILTGVEKPPNWSPGSGEGKLSMYQDWQPKVVTLRETDFDRGSIAGTYGPSMGSVP